MNAGGLILTGLHLIVAAAILSGLLDHMERRDAEVAVIREMAASERTATEIHEAEVATMQRVIEGFRADDPYVVELLARERLGWTDPSRKEIEPPELVDEPGQH